MMKAAISNCIRHDLPYWTLKKRKKNGIDFSVFSSRRLIDFSMLKNELNMVVFLLFSIPYGTYDVLIPMSWNLCQYFTLKK